MDTQPRPTHWPGWLYDGHTAKREPVNVAIGPAGLGIFTEDGRIRFWPFEELRLTQGASAGEPARFEHGGDAPDAVVIHDPAFLPAVYTAAPALRPRLQRNGRANRQARSA